ncbi:MAG: thiamine-phosphate kinase [Microbacterium sp.]
MGEHLTVADLSEGDILRRILARTGRASATLLGPGDDAAVIGSSGAVVATTDTLVHGPDFRLAWTSGFDLGWKSAAVNLADIAAMGARPTALLVAVILPTSTEIAFVEAMADGLRAACDALAPGCAVVGGDLATGDVLTVAVTALGDLDGRAAVTRAGARVGDVVALAGERGQAAAGLAILFERFRDDAGHPIPVDAARLVPGERALVDAQLRPSPPIGLGPIAAVSGATAMMDVSDGLALDARRMADASDVTIDLDPLGERELAGGEDHALLACFPTEALPPGFHAIGRVVARGAAAVTVAGVPYAARGGWDPYQDWDAASG